jgi:hypothetical protein
MKSTLIVSFLAALALSASAALAQQPPPTPPGNGPMAHGAWRMNGEDMQKHRADFCSDIAPRAIGKLAYLEARLALSDRQKPLFERWKNVMLATIRAHADQCATMKLPEMDASVIEKLKLQEQRLKTRLADIQAQMPALEALASSLNEDQMRTLGRAAMRLNAQRGEMMEHMGGMGERFMMMHRPDGGPDDGAPPPPPPPSN